MSISPKSKTKKTIPRKSIGLHITDFAIRGVVLEKTKNGVMLSLSREIPLPEGLVRDGEIIRASALEKKLAQLKKELGITEAHIVVPHEFCYNFDLVLNSVDKKDIEEAVIKYLAESQIVDAENYEIEYMISSSSGGEYLVSVKCTAKKFLEPVRTLLQNLKIKLLSFEPPMQDIKKHVVAGKPSIVVEFGENKTYSAIVADGVPAGFSCIDRGGDVCIPTIEKILKVSHEEASKIHKEHGFLPTHYEAKLLYKLLDLISPIAEEIQEKYLRWAENRRGLQERELGEIIVYGDSAEILGFTEYLSQTIKTIARNINLEKDLALNIEGIPVIPKKEISKFMPTIYAAARGFV